MAGVSDILTKEQEENLCREILERAKSFDGPKILKKLSEEFELLSGKDLSFVDTKLVEKYKELVLDVCSGATKMYMLARDNEEFEVLVIQFKSNDKLMGKIRALSDKDTKSYNFEKSLLKKIIEMSSNLIKSDLRARLGTIDGTGSGGATVGMITALARLSAIASGVTLLAELGLKVVSTGICAIVSAEIGIGLGIKNIRKSLDLTLDITERCTQLKTIKDMLSVQLEAAESYYRENKYKLKYTLLRSCEETKKIYDRSKLKYPDRFELIVSDRIESNYDVYEIQSKFGMPFDIYKKLVETVLPPRNTN